VRGSRCWTGPTCKVKSLATPLGMAFSPDANTLYVAAFGSKKIGVFNTSEIDNDSFTPNAADHIQLSGAGGPTGLVVQGNRIYVLTRFDDSVKVIDRSSKAELQTLALYNPEPPSVTLGRPFLYDAVETSSNGEASCSSCHLFGDMDDLAWDLGNPDDDQKPNNNGFVPLADLDHCGLLPCVFHPMKGPMTTQSLRGLENMGPQHWRGDRDDDLLPDGVETNSGEYVDFSDTGTDPTLVDTDGDGWDDGDEAYNWGTDPTDPFDYPGAPPPSVPSLSPTGLGLLASLLALVAAWAVRTRQATRSG